MPPLLHLVLLALLPAAAAAAAALPATCQGKTSTVNDRWSAVWPALAGKSMIMLQQWVPGHMQLTEPASVAAFIGAIQRKAATATSSRWVLDIGANVGAYTLIGATLGANVLAVDMQPSCAELVRCHLAHNNLSASGEVLNAYVSPPHTTASLRVPIEDCVKTASPTAVAGRFPTGFLSKKTRHMDRLDASLIRQVPPLDVATLLARRLPAAQNLIATKIDVEGYEVHVLESLRSAWHRLGDVVLEVQPRAWKWQNVSTEAALSTFQQLVQARNFRIVQLTHSMTPHHGHKNRGQMAVSYPDVCTMDTLRGEAAISTRALKDYAKGKVAELDIEAFKAVLTYMLHHPRKMGYFRDYYFTSRTCTS